MIIVITCCLLLIRTWSNINNKRCFYIWHIKPRRNVCIALVVSSSTLLLSVSHRVSKLYFCVTHQVEREIEHHDATLLSIMEFYNNCMCLKDERTHDRRIYNYLANVATCAQCLSFFAVMSLFTHFACVALLRDLVSWNWCVLSNCLLKVKKRNGGVSPKRKKKV